MKTSQANQTVKEIYLYLVFTKSVESNFRAFWLAPVTWSILGYSLFCEWREKWRVVSRKFHKKKLWPLMKRPFPKTQRKQPSSAYRCLLVGRKWFFSWICYKIIKMALHHLRNVHRHCQLKIKQRSYMSFTIMFLSIWFGKY